MPELETPTTPPSGPAPRPPTRPSAAGVSRKDLARLADPFEPGDLEWRVQSNGVKGGRVWAIVVPYITQRAVYDRLDDVCGPENWRNEFQPTPSGKGTLAGISIRVDGEWVTKWNGAGDPEVSGGLSAGDAVKGGLSNAEKRAAVSWGIGRYLYRLEASFADTFPPNSNEGLFRGKVRGKGGASDTAYRWNPPRLPDWALPSGSGSPTASTTPAAADPTDRAPHEEDEPPEPPELRKARETVLARVKRARECELDEKTATNVENAAAYAGLADAELIRLEVAAGWLYDVIATNAKKGESRSPRQKKIDRLFAIFGELGWDDATRRKWHSHKDRGGIKSIKDATYDQVVALVEAAERHRAEVRAEN